MPVRQVSKEQKKTKEPPADYYEKHELASKNCNSPKKNAFDLGKENLNPKRNPARAATETATTTPTPAKL
ncbi:hypothetical protein CEXT_795411 [Caerostris extrusa]|uniref:Uncharacterized protein n=1 Tax=Caerostris extrusa TaxID=172846 RepID=A0AAV4XC58_CAEEX|nr:hypothetical protein CEXT_795411 [Caerostris extrusa]